VNKDVQYAILGDLLAFLRQSLADSYDTRRNDWCQQDNESTIFWERSGSAFANADSDPGSL